MSLTPEERKKNTRDAQRKYDEKHQRARDKARLFGGRGTGRVSRFTRAEVEHIKRDFYAMSARDCAVKWNITLGYVYDIARGKAPTRCKDD